MSGAPHKTPHPMEDPPPPVFGTWQRIYIGVLCYLALLMLAFYIFTRAFDS